MTTEKIYKKDTDAMASKVMAAVFDQIAEEYPRIPVNRTYDLLCALELAWTGIRMQSTQGKDFTQIYYNALHTIREAWQ